VPPDPLRTRIYFLNVLPMAKRLAFVRAARKGAERNLVEVRAECKRWRQQGGMRYLADRGALCAMETRCEWLREVEKALSNS
jgi:Virulence activator alpha C-term